ncbi:choice-of-anchor J domain-containing protein [Flavobacterium sp. DGU11]|uniref:Choice-of-anchor J domain-containing protein n=1 Tax=Flavobacterium arundinis TaxID=3139143 RepID=A0ABU9I0J3_9FLAO
MKKTLLYCWLLALFAITRMNSQAFTENFDDVTTLSGNGWFTQNNSQPLGTLSWFQGTNIGATGPFDAYNGAANAYLAANYNSTSGSGTISNWYLMPNRTLRNGDVLTFYTRTPGAATVFPDRLEVRLSTNGASTNVGTTATGVGDFTTLVLSVNPTLSTTGYPGTWTQYTITMAGLPAPTSGRFAFRYFVTGAGSLGTNSDYIGIDNVVYTPYSCPTLTVSAPAGGLTDGSVGIAYSKQFTQTGALGTANYAVTAGALPPGLTLSASGTVSGPPTTPGTYNFTVTVDDTSGCSASSAFSITVINPCTLNATPSMQTNIACNGTSTGAATVGVTGGTAPFTYSWSPSGGTAATATGLSAGTYTVTVSDANGCTDTQAFTITQPTLLNAMAAAQTNISCNGGSNGSATVAVTGGTPGYTYSWAPSGGTAATAAGLAAGTYTVTVTDANGCEATQAFAITQPTALTASPASQTNIACNGGSTGAATVTATGGTAPYTYTWNNGAVTASVSGLAAGTYTATVTDANGCTATQSFTITQPTALTASPASQTNIACNGGSTGAATVTATGGTAPYTYTWNNGAVTASVTGLAAGTYTATVTDAYGCQATQAFTITQPTVLNATAGAQTNIACSGGSNGSATVAVTGGTPGYTYSWAPSGGTAATAAGLAAGTYTVTVTDANGCTATQSFTITQASGTEIVWGSGSSDAAENLNGRFANAFNGAGSWQAVSVFDGNATPGNALWTRSTTGTSNGAYWGNLPPMASPSQTDGVALFDSDFLDNGGVQGAFDTGSSPSPHKGRLISPSFDLSGHNGQDLYVDLYLYYRKFNIDELSIGYSNDGGATWTDVSIQQPGVIFNTAMVTYPLTGFTNAADLTNCKIRFTFNGDYYFVMVDDVTIRTAGMEALSVDIVSQTNIACNGATNGSINLTVSGGAAPYTYGWNNGSTIKDQTGLAAGNYSVTITDANGCTAVKNVTITQPAAALTANATSTNIACNGATNGSISLTVSGGTAPYTYGWNNGTTTKDQTGLAAGNYSVTITDANGCTAVKNVTITQPAAALTANATSTNIACNGASNGSINLTVSGGTAPYTYGWNNGSTIKDQTGLAAGNYSVTITDANGCTAVKNVTITQPAAALTANATSTNIACNGATNGSISLTVSGGTAPYTYGWNNGSTIKDQTGLAAGNYSVTITDANGCTAVKNVTITQPAAALTANATSTNIACNGATNGSISLTVSGGTAPYTYGWNNGSTIKDQTGLAAGNYSVTITDANGCTAVKNVTITQPAAALTASATSTNIACNGGSNGSISLTVSGGTAPYTYGWNNGSTIKDQTGLAAGNYSVTITDANGCTAVKNVTITQPAAALTANATSTNIACNGGSNGSISLTVSGGTTPYTYGWNNGSTIKDQTGLAAGNYSVTITDANGCTAVKNVTITQPAAALTASATSTNIACNGGSNGSISLTVSGGTAPYTYGWNNGSTIKDQTGLAAGNYSVTITDANGCTAVKNVTITQPAAALTANATSTNIACNGGSNGSISLTVSGGTTPYTYGWNNGSTIKDQTGLAAGNYSVTITDANGCTAVKNVTITQPAAALNATAGAQTNVSCNGGSNGSATVAVTGGTPSYTYSWAPSGGTAATATGLAAGTYTVTVTDANGCTDTQSFTITQPTALNATAGAQTNVSCNGGSNGSATVAVTGGTTPSYTYSWAPSGGTAATATGLAAGTYTVTVTDANGCTDTQSFTITQPTVLNATAGAQTNVSCNGGSNGSATVTVTGGTPSYTYSWAPSGGTAATATGLAAGTYTVTVTDANGCTDTQSFTITQPTVLNASATQNFPATCSESLDGGATVTAAGGTTTYTYLWDNGATTAVVTNLSVGSHTVTVTDANGCTATASVTIGFDDTQDPVPSVANLPAITAQCVVNQADVPVPSATDNCVGTIIVTSDAVFPITDQGTTVITWTYEDVNGNTTTQTQDVVITDTTAPVPAVTNLPAITMQCQVLTSDIPVPTATDNCAGTLVASTTDPLLYTALGTYTITWSYDDGNGNITTQTQSVTVTESAINAVTFTSQTVIYNTAAQSISVANLPAGASVAYSITPDTGLGNAAINTGTYTITAVVTPAADAPNCDPVTLTATLTIEQAAQVITFDPIPVKNLEADPDFQLTATASSGLPVYYTYTFTAPTTPASVSSTGWVDMLTSGIVEITAHQDGNVNYLPAAPVTQQLVINSSDASIHNVTIGDVVYTSPGQDIYHLMLCEDTAGSVNVSITTEANASVTPGHTFTIDTPRPGIYSQTVTITSQDGTVTQTYIITVEKMFQFFDVAVQKFDNVLLANNNPETNGGYSFTAYEWYKNGSLVSRNQYFSEGPTSNDLLDPDAEYYLRLTTVEGDVLQTCIGQVTLEHSFRVSVIPNPAVTGGEITVIADFPGEEFIDMRIDIHDINGRLVHSGQTSQRITQVQLATGIEAGVYIVSCTTPKHTQSFKIIVRK